VTLASGRTREPDSWLIEVRPEDGPSSDRAIRILANPTGSVQMASDPSCAIVFAGRLHNRSEISALAEHQVPPTSEAEILLGAYLHAGESILRRLRGCFAVIIWDGRSSTLLAARDPVGVAPLFYASDDHLLLISGSLRTLIASARISRAPSALAVAAHLVEVWPESGETLVDSVRRVSPGLTLRWRGGERKHYRYWDPADGDVDVPSEIGGVRDLFEVLLSQSVDRSLELGAAAIFLSGGLDSATVAALAAERSRVHDLPPPRALSLVYPDPSLNEKDMQRRVAHALGLPQVMIPFELAFDGGGLLGSSLELSAKSEAPSLNLWRPAYDLLVAEAASHGCAVIFSGEGGDEWLMPPPQYAADRLAALDFRGLRQVWIARQRFTPFGFATTTRTVLWEWGFRTLLRQTAGRALQASSPSSARSYRRRHVSQSLPTWLVPDPTLRRELVDLLLDSLPDPTPRRLHQRALRRLVGHPRLGVLMEEWFADGRGHGVQLHEPLLDPDLLELLYIVPPEALIHEAQAKWLARSTLAGRVAGLVPHWPTPVYADRFWLSCMAQEGPATWRRLGGVETLADLGVIDPEGFDQAVRLAFSTGSFHTATQVWAAWTLETWLRELLSPIMVG